MAVAVDQARDHPAVGQVEPAGVTRDGVVRPEDRLDPAVCHEDRPVVEPGPVDDVEEVRSRDEDSFGGHVASLAGPGVRYGQARRSRRSTQKGWDSVTRTALVTGGASGLGQASARRLAEDGVRIVIVDIDPQRRHRLDVSDAQAVRRAIAELGPVDIPINSAGIVGPSSRLWTSMTTSWNAPSPSTSAARSTSAGRSSRRWSSAAGAGSSTSPAWPARTATPTCRPTRRRRPRSSR